MFQYYLVYRKIRNGIKCASRPNCFINNVTFKSERVEERERERNNKVHSISTCEIVVNSCPVTGLEQRMVCSMNTPCNNLASLKGTFPLSINSTSIAWINCKSGTAKLTRTRHWTLERGWFCLHGVTKRSPSLFNSWMKVSMAFAEKSCIIATLHLRSFCSAEKDC